MTPENSIVGPASDIWVFRQNWRASPKSVNAFGASVTKSGRAITPQSSWGPTHGILEILQAKDANIRENQFRPRDAAVGPHSSEIGIKPYRHLPARSRETAAEDNSSSKSIVNCSYASARSAFAIPSPCTDTPSPEGLNIRGTRSRDGGLMGVRMTSALHARLIFKLPTIRNSSPCRSRNLNAE